MNPKVAQTQAQQPEVVHGIYVDDLGQRAVGTRRNVAQALATAGAAFAKAAKAIRLRISPKSVVVASSPLLAFQLKRALRLLGISAKAAQSARDLRLQLNLGTQRRTKLQSRRSAKAATRLLKVGKLAAVNRKARRLAAAGGLAVASWGQAATGLSPTSSQALRSLFAPLWWLRHETQMQDHGYRARLWAEKGSGSAAAG